MESDILLALNFNIKAVTSCWHLDEYLQCARIEGDNRMLCQYLLDLSLIEYNFCLVKPSLLSWGIILYVTKMRLASELCEL